MTHTNRPPSSVAVATTREQLWQRLQYAFGHAIHPVVRQELGAALHDLEQLPEARLARCATCGRVGLPERIATHECELFPAE
jgi:hypothetical protein